MRKNGRIGSMTNIDCCSRLLFILTIVRLFICFFYNNFCSSVYLFLLYLLFFVCLFVSFILTFVRLFICFFYTYFCSSVYLFLSNLLLFVCLFVCLFLLYLLLFVCLFASFILTFVRLFICFFYSSVSWLGVERSKVKWSKEEVKTFLFKRSKVFQNSSKRLKKNLGTPGVIFQIFL